eukprot:1142348-Pelagomonas_calceolata.AAC.2
MEKGTKKERGLHATPKSLIICAATHSRTRVEPTPRMLGCDLGTRHTQGTCKPAHLVVGLCSLVNMQTSTPVRDHAKETYAPAHLVIVNGSQLATLVQEIAHSLRS